MTRVICDNSIANNINQYILHKILVCRFSVMVERIAYVVGEKPWANISEIQAGYGNGGTLQGASDTRR